MIQKNKQSCVGDMEVSEVNEYKKLALEYVQRLETIDDEIDTLKGDKKTLKEEFEKKIDLKTLMQVVKVLKLEAGVIHKDTFDIIKEALEDSSQ